MNELALFAGAGGGILGGKILGWRTICAVEYDKYAASVLVARQNDGCLEPFPIWDDVRTFDGKPWRGRVDVVSGGFPCQDISCAGTGAGLDGERSGLWGEMARIIREVRPRYVFVENSPMLTSRGLHRVLGDLAEMGFDAEWGVLGADDVGANHIRKRIWINACHPDRNSKPAGTINGQAPRMQSMVANAACSRRTKGSNRQSLKIIANGTPKGEARRDNTRGRANLANAAGERCHSRPTTGEQEPPTPLEEGLSDRNRATWRTGGPFSWWKVEPDVGRLVDGLASRVDRLKCLGNGQVPAVAATAFKLLSERGSR